MALTVSTRRISETTGMSVRQIQTLTDAGALVPDEGSLAPGRGGSRQYPPSELEVATLLAPISFKGMAVAEARGLAQTFRTIVTAHEQLGFTGIDEARELRRHLWSQLYDHKKPDAPSFKKWIADLAAVKGWIVLALTKKGEADPIMFLYRDKDQWRFSFWAIVKANFPRSGTHNRGSSLALRGPNAIEDDRDMSSGAKNPSPLEVAFTGPNETEDDLDMSLSPSEIPARPFGGYALILRNFIGPKRD